jgi:macrolide transport system ATP-binding/permease protein
VSLLRNIFEGFQSLFRKEQHDREFDEELRSYLEMAIDEKIKQGMSRKDAARAVRLERGDIQVTKEIVRASGWESHVDSWWHDVRFGLRMLKRSPGFTVTVIITLALAIGANTAIFSLVNALMLKKLPYDHPERMGTIYTRVTGSQPSDERHHLNGEQWELLRDNVPSLVPAITGGLSGVNLRSASHASYVQNARISAHYLDVLALQPMIGRNFSLDEDRPNGPKVAILSYDLWRNVFGQDPNILGQSILLKGEPHSVIGVLPQGATTPLNADVYTPLQPSPEGEGGGTNFTCIVRLRDDATWQQANAEINRVWALRPHRYELQRNPNAQVTYYSVPLQKGETDSLRPQVLGLMLAAGFILLIACANLAGLTLVHILRRTAEVATRIALGATSWQIRRQFWIESLLLALVGGAAGVGVGFLALRGLLLLLPEHFLPVASVSLDSRVLAFSACAALCASLLFGMLPALFVRKLELRSSMASRGASSVGSLRLRQGLIVGEVALTVVLLAASGLLIRTLVHLETLPAAFNPDGILVAKASLDDARYHDAAAFRRLLNESIAAMRQIPGVQNAAFGLALPYERTVNDGVTLSDGKEAGQQEGTDEIYVTPGYFETLQMPLLAGRFFTDADGPDTQKVAVVNQTFSRRFYGGGNPVGHYINKDTLIVGEVSDVPVSSGLYEGAPLMTEQAIYTPAAQEDAQILSLVHVWFQPDWIVRSSAPVEGLPAQIQSALSSADANLPASGFYNMKDLLARTLTTQRIEVALLGVLAALALLLSAVGIFALVANMIAQKTREIGIRMALGSTIPNAMIHVGRLGLGASAAGLLLGLLLCAAMLPAMSSVLYGVGAYDVRTILSMLLTLGAVALLASIVPALRVARIDPAKTLREE